MTAEAIYVLCAATSFFCCVLLFRGFIRSRARLLLWSGSAFLVFTIANILLVADLILFPSLDLSLWRTIANLVGLVLLLCGLILDS